LKKQKKNIFEVGRTHQFRSSSTSKPPEPKRKIKKKPVSKNKLETKNKNEKTTQTHPESWRFTET